MVIRGRLRIKLRDGELNVAEGEFVIIPKGTEHLPVADEECHVMLFEPANTLNTGNIKNERTVETLQKV